jgi:hypothetical protein
MKSAGLRLALAVMLFAGWIGWLVYLAVKTPRPVSPTQPQPWVLSRPQFLVSSLDVIAEVDGINGKRSKVTVVDVHWPGGKQTKQLVGKAIPVTNLAECRDDWTGPGEYILPLIATDKDEYGVAPQPPSPGFPSGRPRIYRVTPQTLGQLREICKPETLHLPEF